MRYNFLPVRMAIVKNKNMSEDSEQLESLAIVGGNKKPNVATVKNSMATLQIIKNETATCSSH